ncbi:MAG: PEP-CTERM sorting domain-containing protein, partial [Alphaproteobacteria bacterium]
MTIHATPTAGFTAWDLTFNDTGDGLFQLSELTSFTGYDSAGTHYSTIVWVPDIPGIATASANNTGSSDAAGKFLWCFGSDAISGCAQTGRTRWSSYDFVQPEGGGTGEGVTAPEPSTWALMLLAFAALAHVAGLSRRKATPARA